MWLCLPLGNLWIRIGIFTQLWYIKCCRFNCICENFSLKSILKVSRFYESDEAVGVTHMFGQLLQKCWNLGLAGLSATALCCYLDGKLGSWIRLPPLPPFSLRKYLGYNLGVVSLSLQIFVGRVHYTTHEFGGPESDNTIFLRVCCLSTLCFGDELVRFSKTAQIFELIKFESKYLDISNCIFRMNSSSEKNICLFFRGGLHLHEEKFHPCSWKLLHTSHIWKCWLILETCASYQCTVSISFQLMMISHTVYT